MLLTLSGLLQDGSIPDPGISQNSRATLRLPRGSDLTIQVNVRTCAGISIPPILGDELYLTVKRNPGDESPVFRKQAVPEITTPVNAPFTLGAGVLGADEYFFRVSAENGLGETLASPETSFTIEPGDAPAGINVNWGAVPGAISYNIYGREEGLEEYMDTVLAPITTWLDDGSVTPSGDLPDPTFWEFRIVPDDTMDLEGNFVFDVILIHNGYHEVIVPASPFIIEPSPGYGRVF